MLFTWRTALAGLALALGALTTFAPAAAAGAAPRVASQITENWSGYMDHHAVNYTSVSASWVQPAIPCKSGRSAALFWVGMDGFYHGTFEGIGTEVKCTGGTAQYFGWYEMYPRPVVRFESPVKPGDTISASVTGTTANKFTVKITDTTEGWSQTAHKTVDLASRDSVEIITERLGRSTNSLWPLSDFGAVKYTNVMVNGSMIGGSDPTRVYMEDNKNRNLISLSPVTGGTNFTVTWQRAT
jgi:peptidase A4-like protein